MKTKTLFAIALIAFAGCNRREQTISGPLKQRGYLWQRDWTPAVVDSIGIASRELDGVVLLGAEVEFAKAKPKIDKAIIDWEAVKRATTHCAVALRVAPFGGPFRADDNVAHTIVDLSKELIDEARIHGVELEEFQLDFDCARKNLGGYRSWLGTLRSAIHPTRFVITALPAWLDDPEFRKLAREVDGYVLQVHSVPIASGKGAQLTDARLARQWVDKAAKLRIPFSVALPTYRCVAGYGPDGKLLSVAMDSVQPSWPPGTRVLEFGANADEIADLVQDWQHARPSQLRELLWYRIPIGSDARNWRWTTLVAVKKGRRPERKLNVRQDGANPIDLSILNEGEADEQVHSNVTASWNGPTPIASDALSGWSVRLMKDRAIFQPAAPDGLRLAPGSNRKIGWLRFERPTNLQIEFSNGSESLR